MPLLFLLQRVSFISSRVRLGGHSRLSRGDPLRQAEPEREAGQAAHGLLDLRGADPDQRQRALPLHDGPGLGVLLLALADDLAVHEDGVGRRVVGNHHALVVEGGSLLDPL